MNAPTGCAVSSGRSSSDATGPDADTGPSTSDDAGTARQIRHVAVDSAARARHKLIRPSPWPVSAPVILLLQTALHGSNKAGVRTTTTPAFADALFIHGHSRR